MPSKSTGGWNWAPKFSPVKASPILESLINDISLFVPWNNGNLDIKNYFGLRRRMGLFLMSNKVEFIIIIYSL